MFSAYKRHTEGSEKNRPTIPGMALAIERPHLQYGSAVYVKAGLAIEATSMSEDHDIGVLSVELSSTVVTSVCKPPPVDFMLPKPASPVHCKPQIITGDINSTSAQWRYCGWMDSNQLSLIHDPKLPDVLRSARWKCGYNPDLLNHWHGKSHTVGKKDKGTSHQQPQWS